MMRRPGTFSLIALTVGISLNACGKNSGPDQTLVIPSPEWSVASHQPGTLNLSTWDLESKGTTIEITSFVTLNAPSSVVERLKSSHEYMVNEAQTLPMLSRYWTVGAFKFQRQFAPVASTDLDHGVLNILADSKTRVISFIFRNPEMKKVDLIKLGEKTAEDIANANIMK